MRPKHYIKNGLIFLPLLFSRNFLQPQLLKTTIYGFLLFSLAASIIYIFNDIRDAEKDKKHPTKKDRPIASGRVSKTKAAIFILILTILTITLNYICFSTFLPHSLILTYWVLNILYSIHLKNVPILDITILSIGFILRVFFEAALINVVVSDWLYLTIIANYLIPIPLQQRLSLCRPFLAVSNYMGCNNSMFVRLYSDIQSNPYIQSSYCHFSTRNRVDNMESTFQVDVSLLYDRLPFYTCLMNRIRNLLLPAHTFSIHGELHIVFCHHYHKTG